MSSKKKVKVQCLECNAVFDHYYRKNYNFKQHSNLLKKKKIVRYQIHGAPKNVFEAASKKSSMPSSKASDTDIENENDEFCNTDEPEPMNTTENSEIRCEEISNQKEEVENDCQVDLNIPKPDQNQNTLRFEFVQQQQISTQVDSIVTNDNSNSSSSDSDIEVNNDEMLDGTDLSWSSCAGLLKNLINELDFGRHLLSEVSNSDRFNAKAFVSKVKLVADNISSKVKELSHVCNLVLDNWTDPVAVEEVDIESGTVPGDPAERPSKLHERQRQFLIKSGPTQPRLAKYPKNSDIKKGKQSSFKSDWYSEYPHLEYSIKNDSVYCFVCSLFPEGPAKLNAEESWIKLGVRSWHK